jgi:aminobenzoyl-glutamate utilization protein B
LWPLSTRRKPVVGLRTTTTPLGGRSPSASSNDNGDVSWVVPAGLLHFPASVPGIQYHEWKVAVTPVSSISHRADRGREGARGLDHRSLDLARSPAEGTRGMRGGIYEGPGFPRLWTKLTMLA